ncbi:protein kinase [Streptomyces sp. NPDC006879]|uniref:serine/threonine-protein kinase n=1 Tax=Streptomyces sp. NPDC006879 TaxID=3364767 RepID=UPI0036C0533F
MDQLAPGDPQHIGSYRLLTRLGSGGMGHVYLARSDRGRTVAVKLVRPELAVQEPFRRRFRQEVGAARRVGGQWTAPVLDADTDARVPWVATGYVAGPSLHSAVTAHGPLPERSVRILAAGLAYALRDIHAAGIVHRDLKPSNVLMTLDGPRVIDFGIARALEPLTSGGLTRTGEVVGSPGFMAPEQVRGEAVTPACDVFSLGSLLAYAATGVLPFADPTGDGNPHSVMFRIANEEPELPGLPESLRALVRDCLAKDPTVRPTPEDVLTRVGAGETVADGRPLEPWLPGPLVTDLGRHAVQLLEWEAPGPVRPATTLVGPPTTAAPSAGGAVPTAPAPSRRSAVALAALAVAVALGAAGGVYAVYRSSGAGPQNPGHQPEAHTSVASGPDGGPGASPAADAPGGNDPKALAPTPPVATATTAAPAGSAGTVPPAYLGVWAASFEGNGGTNTRRLVLRQGRPGDPVMTLTGQGPTHTCVWNATLLAAGPPLRLSPSTVTSGNPATCSPGEWSRLTLRPDGTLTRELVGSTGVPLTYRKVAG